MHGKVQNTVEDCGFSVQNKEIRDEFHYILNCPLQLQKTALKIKKNRYFINAPHEKLCNRPSNEYPCTV